MEKELLLDSYFQMVLAELTKNISMNNYLDFIVDIAIWLTCEDAIKEQYKKYDDILKNLKVSKNQFIKWLVESFIRINENRLKNNIKIDDRRKKFIDFFSDKGQSQIDIRVINRVELSSMYMLALADTVSLSKHPSPLHNLKMLMPEASLEDLYSPKELILYEIIDCVSNSTERKIFSEGHCPNLFTFVTKIEIDEKLISEVIDMLNKKMGVSQSSKRYKAIILEMFLSVCTEKSLHFNVLSNAEKKLLDELLSMKYPLLNDLAKFYTDNQFQIISIILTNCLYVLDIEDNAVPDFSWFMNEFSTFEFAKAEL